jgi:hypothetical protein
LSAALVFLAQQNGQIGPQFRLIRPVWCLEDTEQHDPAAHSVDLLFLAHQS